MNADPGPPRLGRALTAVGGPSAGAGGGAHAHRPLRTVLGRFATGVTVVTTRHWGRAAGLTVNSFTSLSLDPPLVLWCLARSSASLRAFTGARHFAVNILAADQTAVAARFAAPGDRFTDTAFQQGPHEVPLLCGTVGSLLCRTERTFEAGDHIAFVGAVLGHRADAGAPLLYLDGGFRTGALGASRPDADARRS